MNKHLGLDHAIRGLVVLLLPQAGEHTLPHALLLVVQGIYTLAH